MEFGLQSIRRVRAYGSVPGQWRDVLPPDAFEPTPRPDLCLVDFADDAATQRFARDQRNWPALGHPLVVAVSATDPVNALDAGADVVLAADAPGTHFAAQLRRIDKHLSFARQRQNRLTAMRQRLSRIMSNYRAIDSDLAQAQALQQSLLQNRQSIYGDSVLSLLLEQRSQLGGDLVGQFPVNDSVVGFFAFDVSGHGITSALLIARLAGMVLGASAETNISIVMQGTRHVPRSPAQVLETLNRIMFDELESDHFFTAILGFFNHHTGQVVLSQAGHPNPLLIRPNAQMQSIGKGGLPIGLLPGAEFTDIDITLSAQDRLLIASDGITETPSGDGAGQVTEQGLAQLLSRYHQAPGLDLFDHLLADLRRFQGGAQFQDDVSAVLIDYRPAPIKPATAHRSPDTASSVAASRAGIQTAV